MKNLRTHFQDRYCRVENRKSFALNQLDKKLAKYLTSRKGFFIEAGGNDGIRQSNTLYYEKYLGWRGLLVEAVPPLAEMCRSNRPNCIVEECALVSDSFEENTVKIEYRDLMSLIRGGGIFSPEKEQKQLDDGEGCMREGDTPTEYTVQVNTLNNLLEKHRISKIDFFSLDVEGFELEVLNGFDLERYAPEFILVEVQNEAAIQNILSPWYDTEAVLHAYPNSHKDILYQRKR